jgi:hypothetical protein
MYTEAFRYLNLLDMLLPAGWKKHKGGGLTAMTSAAKYSLRPVAHFGKSQIIDSL